MIAFCRCILMTYQEHLGVTYIFLDEDRSPRMLIHNKCPVPLLLKETVKGLASGQDREWFLWRVLPVVTTANCISSLAETPRTEVHCRPVPANSSLHHELYHHFSTFPECRQRDVLPTLLLKTASDNSSHDWTDPVDINCFGTQVRLQSHS